MEGIQGWQKELPMFKLNTPKDLQEWAIGCDKDIGGMNVDEIPSFIPIVPRINIYDCEIIWFRFL
jgi:hypothetical protein